MELETAKDSDPGTVVGKLNDRLAGITARHMERQRIIIVLPDRLEILMRVEVYHFPMDPDVCPTAGQPEASHQDFLTTLEMDSTISTRIYQCMILPLKTIVTMIRTTDRTTFAEITWVSYACPPSGALSVSCRDGSLLNPARDVVGIIRQECCKYPIL
ncbi:hypothetical protein L486_01051 [Kwoniella mangroviensis CBS 10435]|uniref:Uncharacterized protein n=1 Tax=Kwoniella mangroviensis CBS 10435 TaxID=1331196 RepID=A0A1B9J0W0_9TREE|nr:hypothetical protein L486_01051 [Kwoniella mangroviensis CBS 10435]